MENNKLKEKIRKNIKEEIAISNIRKEFGMKTSKNKVIYMISSVCAILILGIGILIGTSKLNNNLFQDNTLEIGKTEENKNNEGSLNVELNINKIKDEALTNVDADIKIIELESLPEKFDFIKDVAIPEEYELKSIYNIYIRKDRDVAEYNLLHDYVFNYRKDDLNNIIIAFSEIEEPIRDYYVDGGDKISKIGDVELKIAQSESQEMYIATFEYKGIYFDIETTGVTEHQLVDLLESLIKNVNQ